MKMDILGAFPLPSALAPCYLGAVCCVAFAGQALPQQDWNSMSVTGYRFSTPLLTLAFRTLEQGCHGCILQSNKGKTVKL